MQATDTTAPQVTLTGEGSTPLVLGQAGTLHVSATDDCGVVQTTLTVNGPPLPLPTTGTAVYVPPAVGTYTVIARTTDAAGQADSATTTVVVEADTIAPVLHVAVVLSVMMLTQPVSVTVSATDTVAITTTSLRVAGPGFPNGRALTLAATAQNPSGNTGTTTFVAQGVPDTTSPVVRLTGVSTTTAAGQPVTLTVTATDDMGVTARTLLLNHTPQPLAGSSRTTYTPPLVGAYTAVATAIDATGNVGMAQLTFQAIDAAQNAQAPLVLLTTPSDDATITAPTTMRGTVQDVTLVRWTLALAPPGEKRLTTLATGTTVPPDGVFGLLDPTLLLNDLYELRLTAEDANGRLTTLTSWCRSAVG